MIAKSKLLPIAVQSLFFAFLLSISIVATLKETQAKIFVKTANGLVSAQLYPDWFFQLMLLLIIVAAAILGATLAFYFRKSSVQHMSFAHLALDALVLSYLGMMYGLALYAMMSGGPIRIVWLPFVSASAYTVTVLTYTTAGFWLFRRFGWKVVIPLGIIGILQEATWNVGYYSLYPNFVASVSTQSWIEYVSVIIVAAPILIALQERWFTIRLRRNPWILVFPLYFALYYLLGMPTVDGAPEAAHTNSLVFEGTYVATCLLSYLKGVGLDARV